MGSRTPAAAWAPRCTPFAVPPGVPLFKTKHPYLDPQNKGRHKGVLNTIPLLKNPLVNVDELKDLGIKGASFASVAQTMDQSRREIKGRKVLFFSRQAMASEAFCLVETHLAVGIPEERLHMFSFWF